VKVLNFAGIDDNDVGNDDDGDDDDDADADADASAAAADDDGNDDDGLDDHDKMRGQETTQGATSVWTVSSA
jgi:hypothetical protein